MQVLLAATGTLESVAAIVGAALVLVVVLQLLRRRRRHREWGLDDEGVEAVVAEREISPAVERLIGTPAIQAAKLRIPPRAEAPGRVPSPGVMHVGGVDLPTGRPTRPVDAAVVELVSHDAAPGGAAGIEQLWVAARGGDGEGRFKRLAAGFAQSGLWPLLLPMPQSDDHTEWFDVPARRHESDRVDVSRALREHLADSIVDGSPLESTDLIAASNVARGELQVGGGRRLDALDETLGLLPGARLALAPGRRPADVIHTLAWPGADVAGMSTTELAQIVASWEERYGALLVSIDEGSLLFAVLRPPSTIEQAIELVAELHALCPDEALHWGTDRAAAEQLVDAPTWRLSWSMHDD
ncbi:MAG: DUF4253 domain-containing protein [Thermoleophilia bacterium]|nr:DUF4253 domain-containing protein [Thermoleophilia bacterium]